MTRQKLEYLVPVAGTNDWKLLSYLALSRVTLARPGGPRAMEIAMEI